MKVNRHLKLYQLEGYNQPEYYSLKKLVEFHTARMARGGKNYIHWYKDRKLALESIST